jgi:phage portal protein BeeE
LNLVQRVRRGHPDTEDRSSIDQYIADVAAFYYSGLAYAGVPQSYDEKITGKRTERADSPFEHWVGAAYKRNGVVFACQVARLLLFSEARFIFQELRDGRPGDLFHTDDLGLLERPWVNGSSGELLARMIQDVDLAGNAYMRRTGPLAEPALERLRPDWTYIVLGSNSDLLVDEVVGYLYEPGGPGKGGKPIALTRDEVAHWSPIPDPIATYRGMSWLTPCLREIQADGAATDHKQKFFDHAATPNMVIKFDPAVAVEKAKAWKIAMEAEHRGVANAYKNLYIGGGADATVVGVDFKQMDFKVVQGAGETRIAADAGVPPVIVGLSEGLAAATYSNYAQARRRFADMTIRPLWRSCCAALERLVIVPPRRGRFLVPSRLWYDDRDIPALQEDEKDAADIESVKATTIASLVREGFEPESVVKAVMAQDMSLLSHTGALSVQLLQPGQSPASTNGSQPAAAVGAA